MRNKGLYMWGTGVSAFGDGLQNIAMIWLVLQQTGSSLAIAGVIACKYLPALLLSPWAGVYADHHDAKRMTVFVDGVRALPVGVIAMVVLLHIKILVLLYLLQALLAVCSTLFFPASQTLVKETFADRDLVDVLTKSNSLSEAAQLVGSGAAGLLIASFSPVIGFFVNAASYLVSAACNSALQRLYQREKVAKEYDFLADLRGGWQFILDKQGMLYLLLLSVVSSASLQMVATVLAPLAKRFLGGTSTLYGALDVTFTLGSVLSGLVVSIALRKWGSYVTVVTLLGMGVCAGLAGFRGSIELVGVSVFGLGFFTMFHLVTMQTLIQVNTPRTIIGCVIGIRQIVASATKISSALAAGVLVDHIDVKFVFWGFAVLVALTFLSASQIKKVPVPATLR